MSARARPSVDANHRARVLRALGVVPWTRRMPAAAAEDTGGQSSVAGLPLAVDGDASCAVVLAQHCSNRALDLLGRALNAGGPLLARAGRVHVRDGNLVGLPAAATYLVFGGTQADALRRSLPPGALRHAEVVVVDELAAVLVEAGAKRRLWMALRSLRARLTAAGG